jgi:hypothetical protein
MYTVPVRFTDPDRKQSGDTVRAMEHYNLDSMFMLTVTMGFVGLLMAWVILVIAIKGWAVRKEANRAGRSIGKA